MYLKKILKSTNLYIEVRRDDINVIIQYVI